MAVRRFLRKHPYAADMQQAFVRYARALDSVDFDSSFLKLWSLLETLTNTIGDNYDVTIRRVLFLVTDRDLSGLILEHLRNYRNATVHHDRSRLAAERYIYQLKRFVEVLLHFHTVSRGQFPSIAKLGEHLDLPFAPEDLRARILAAKAALRFRSTVPPRNRPPRSKG